MGSIQQTSMVSILEQPIMTPRRIRIVCVGAGFAGLMLAYQIKYNSENSFIDLQIYEKNAGIGGTWYENTYPGAACDVPSHIYTFPFAPNPNWSRFYASSSEILKYLESVAEKYGLGDNIKVNFRVISSIWNDDSGKWTIKVQSADGEVVTDEADVLINGSGILNRRKLPEIPGLDSFRGHLLHSAAWDSNLDWKDKRVGMIGNGSSAIQILPQMQPAAKSVTEYIRTPTWIIPDFLIDFTPKGENFEYSEEQKQAFRDNPTELRDLRRKMEHAFNTYFSIFQAASPAQAAVRDAFTALMKQKLNGNEKLASVLIPDFPVGCRRITPGNGYLEALQTDNVHLNFDPITRITPTGIVTHKEGESETEQPLDIIICATGFDVSFTPAWEMRGRNGVSLADLWTADGNAEAYLGIFAPEMPNYFIYNGPNCPIGHGSLMGAMDAATALILRLCRKLASEELKSMCVKNDVVAEYNAYAQSYLSRTVWASNCRSWYKNHKTHGPVTAMYPGSVLHYRQMLANVRLEDFEYTSLDSAKGNRFRFMGNGITQLEADGGPLGDYLEQ